MKTSTIAVTATLLHLTAACTSSRTSATAESRHSSSVTTSITVPDTIAVRLPQYSETVTIPDSVSTLTNAYAKSSVRINRDGTITHSLATRDTTTYIPIVKTTVRTDSITSSSSKTREKTCRNIFSPLMLLLPAATLVIVAIMLLRH